MENENTTNPNPAPQGGPAKYCTTCGAQLHMQAEICPKCGVRQAPPPGTPADTASRKGGGRKNRWLIGFCVLLALLVIGPQVYRSQAMPRFNKRAEADLRGARRAVEALYNEFGLYGSSMKGTLPGPGGDGSMLVGRPLPAATESSEGAMIGLSGKDGKKAGIGIEVGAGVLLVVKGINRTWPGRSVYVTFSKHLASNRVYFASSITEPIYYCENNAWAGNPKFFEELRVPDSQDGFLDLAGQPCGGSPVSIWQKL